MKEGAIGFLAIVGALLAGLGIARIVMRPWNRLASIYGARQEPAGPKLRFRSLRIGRVAYGNCVEVTLSAGGLHLRFYPFSLLCVPLAIPWEDIALSIERRVAFDCVLLRCRNAADLALRFGPSVARTIHAFDPKLLPAGGEARGTSIEAAIRIIALACGVLGLLAIVGGLVAAVVGLVACAFLHSGLCAP